MFGRSKRRGEPAGTAGVPPVFGTPSTPAKRHGRRPIRSSPTGSQLPNPDSRISRFELDARGALHLLQHHLGDELQGVHIGFATAPRGMGESEQPLYYAVDRAARTIILFRMPIQRARGLHVDDAEHRRLFVEHCVHRAVCEYLGLSPWDVLPGRFDHY
ncbi:metallopeptidase family protein [Leucobacter sp. W1153]|uniref:metallopeptidase family protein n=1 Tax=Leucobacter sp. W1153 TaxID=3439064 RepID=UPI003F3A6385